MKPIRMTASNFLSFKDFDYEFEDRVVTLVGENLTEEDQGSNGSGKSSVQQVFYYSLIGSSLRGSSDKKLIRRGEKEARTHIEIWCPMRNETLYIDRVLPLKSSSKLTIKINDKDVSYATVKDGNDFILKWIGISAEDLRNYFIICKEYYKSFFKASNTDRLALISRFINFNKLDGVKDIISEEKTKLNAEKRSLENDIYSLQGKLEVQMQNIEKEISRDFEKEKEIRISALEKEISLFQEQIESKQKEVDELSVQVIEKDRWVNRFKDFKMYLAAEQVKNIQNRANKILEKENSDLRLIVEAFKQDSKGNRKDEITPYVIRDEAESFWYYSGGERAKVEVATIIAFQQMINSTNPYGGLEFISFDEVTEGLSKEGLFDMVEALDSMLKFPVLVTTHVLDGSYLEKCKVLRIRKENSVSKIV